MQQIYLAFALMAVTNDPLEPSKWNSAWRQM